MIVGIFWIDGMQMKSIVILFIMLIVLATGCTPALPSPPSTPVPEPTPSSTPTPSPIPTPPTSPLAPTPTPVPKPTTTPTPTPTPDTTPPSAITGLVATDAYDGRVNLWWDRSNAEDFDHYAVYANKTDLVETSGMTPVHQITDITTNIYQVTGLEEGAKYYFALVAIDKSGNQNTRVTGVSATSTPMPKGTADSDISVDVYESDKVWAGTTLLPDNHNIEQPRIIEVNMLGEIVWEYLVPQNLRQYTNPGFDVELLANNNILLVLPGNGVYEIDRNGSIIWSYLDKKVSHDADRLPNGNTLVVYGNEDGISDAQVKEINPEGEIVWAWHAKDHFYKAPYKDIFDQGWTHTNAVSRLPSGNTLISPRNFNIVVEVDPQGLVVRTIGEGTLHSQHDPEMLPDGNMLIANHGTPHRAIEIDLKTGNIVWQSAGFTRDAAPVRDANRLPNGNTLITGTTKIVEVTTAGKIVWQLRLKGITLIGMEGARLGFYKAERISVQK